MTTEEQILAITQNLKAYRSPEHSDFDYGRKLELGTLSFDEVVGKINTITGFFIEIPVTVLHNLPKDWINTLEALTQNFYKLIMKIRNFEVTNSDNISNRNNIITECNEQYDAILTKLLPIITYIRSEKYPEINIVKIREDISSSFEHNINELKKEVQKQINQRIPHLEETQETLIKIQNESQHVLDTLREEIAENSIGKEAKFFEKTANAHKNIGTKWLCASTLFGIILILFSTALFTGYFKPSNLTEITNYEFLYFISNKIILLVVLSTTLFFCIKNYTAHQHNYIINKHRQNSLQTYKTLVEGAHNNRSQDIVLIQAANSIYSQQSTGYSSESKTEASNIKSIIELLSKSIQNPEK